MQLSPRTREWTLVGLVAVTALLANLPEQYLDSVGVRREHLLGLLALTVFIALFLYLKFMSFFLVAVLAISAGMPDSISESLGFSRVPIIIAMVAMVGFALINKIIGMLPTGLEQKPKEKTAEGVKVLMYAVEKGNLVYAQKILAQNVDPNMLADNGYTPLMYAAARGDAKMVDLLVRNGADVNMISKDGDTALELALRTGAAETAEIIKNARAEQLARDEALRSKQGAPAS